MLSPSDPLFWLILVGMTLPWGLVAWLGIERDRLAARIDDLLAKPLSYWEWRERNRQMLNLAARGTFAAFSSPQSASDGKVVRFRRPPAFGTVEVEVLGRVNEGDKPKGAA